MRRPPARTASAIRYPGSGAPKLVATGRGDIAERILEAARDAGVPVHEDPLLAEALARLELGTEIPPALYQAVAEVLVWALRLDGQTRSRPPR
jgi:flagellar biosynthesis protein